MEVQLSIAGELRRKFRGGVAFEPGFEDGWI